MTRYNYDGVNCENCEGYSEVPKGKLTFLCSIKQTRECPTFNTASICLSDRLFKRKS